MTLSALFAVPPRARELGWLTALVEVAVQLELATIPPYLTAYWSIKDAGHPVARSLFEIVLEEMQHLGAVCNLLVGLGGTVKLREAALAYPCTLPGGVHPGLTLSLRSFGPGSVESFMAVEYPETGDTTPPPDGDTAATIGEFYSLLEESFAVLAPVLDTSRQVEGMGLRRIHGSHDVQRALEKIKRQGEGSQYSPADSSVHDLSHYYRFKEMRVGRRYRFDATRGQWEWAEAIDVPGGDAVWSIAVDADGGEPPGPQASTALSAFDTAYTSLLRQLESAWSNGDADILSASARAMAGLGAAAIAVMRIARPDGRGCYGPRFRVEKRSCNSP